MKVKAISSDFGLIKGKIYIVVGRYDSWYLLKSPSPNLFMGLIYKPARCFEVVNENEEEK